MYSPSSSPSPMETLPSNSVPREGVPTSSEHAVYPKHPAMADEQARLASFQSRPATANYPIKPQALAQAGFFYTLNADHVKCFYCDGGLKDWEPGDNPWVEHARWYPQCQFLLQERGEDFVREIQASQSYRLQTNQQHFMQHVSDPTWYTYISYEGQQHLYNSRLGISMPMRDGRPGGRFTVTVDVDNRAMVLDVASVEFMKIQPPTARRCQVTLEIQGAVMDKLREVLFNNSTEFPDQPCVYRPGKIYVDRSDRKTKVIVGSAAHSNLKLDWVLAAPINNVGAADVYQIVPAKKASLTPTSDDQYYDMERLLDDLDKRFFSSLGPNPHQIRADLANLAVTTSTYSLTRKLTAGWPTLWREPSPDAISTQAPHELGTGHIPKSTTFLHTVDQRGLRHESNRLATFTQWPESSPVKPENLASAGFFYTGKGQNVQCCICGNVVSDWKEGEDPEMKHFYLFPDCDFILSYDVGNVPISVSSNERFHADEESELERLREERLCKICMVEEANMVFLPCGHIAVCQDCSVSLHCCPICRENIQGTVRTYFA